MAAVAAGLVYLRQNNFYLPAVAAMNTSRDSVVAAPFRTYFTSTGCGYAQAAAQRFLYMLRT